MHSQIGKRKFLGLATGMLVGGAAASLGSVSATGPSPSRGPIRRIFAAGGGFVSSVDPERKLMRFVLSLARVPNPQVCCLPTASGDNLESLVSWYEVMQPLECRPQHLRLFGPTNRLRNFEEQLLGADVIFVPGGNTLNMLGVWRAQGVDLLLRKAWEQGTVLAGESAGMICWFEQGVTDSRPGALGAMPCLGWLPGSACPHYHNPQRRPAYHELMGRGEIRAGLACEDGVGFLFEDTRLEGAYALSEKAAAFRVHSEGGAVVEERLPARVLPRPS
jgi:peptidase E